MSFLSAKQGIGASLLAFTSLSSAPVAPSGPVTSKHRYWGIQIRANAGDSGYTDVSNVQFRSLKGGPNIATGGIASSSVAPAYDTPTVAFTPASKVEWTGTGFDIPILLSYDFGTPVSVIEISIDGIYDVPTRTVSDFEVVYSDDGATWVSDDWCGYAPTWVASTPIVFTKAIATGAKRFWRLRGDQLTSVSELQFYAVISGLNLSLGAAASFASTTYPGYPASNALDGDINTLWSGNGTVVNGGFIGVDFGSGISKTIVQTIIYARNDAYYGQAPAIAYIENSVDGITYMKVLTKTGLTWSAGSSNTIP